MNPSSLYIHIPFCRGKCLFCAFVISVGQERLRDDYVTALVGEMKNYQGRRVHSVYLGGGTPSMLSDNQLGILIKNIRKNFLLETDAEITIEVNPESIDLPKARFLNTVGFNRVSLGVQSTNDRYLKFLGRSHNAKGAMDAYGILREAGFVNINLDLMYAFPGQTQPELEEDVRAIARQKSEHLSLYTLTIEPNSRFYTTRMKLDDDEKLAGHYLLVVRILEEHGFKQYEVSNFAQSGFESQHNINYWQGGSYIGLGVGAHGFLEDRRYWNTSNLQQYIQKAGRQTVVEGYEDLSVDTKDAEKLVFGLRMNKGVAWDRVRIDRHKDIQPLIEGGFLVLEHGFLKTTEQGRLVLDELSIRLI
jgi:oxygen-independent coproporphyrinogen-3 oxidase